MLPGETLPLAKQCSDLNVGCLNVLDQRDLVGKSATSATQATRKLFKKAAPESRAKRLNNETNERDIKK